jgi:hypothetical protein
MEFMFMDHKTTFITLFAVTLSFFSPHYLNAMEAERVVHYFSPPQLEEENIGKKVLCVRPVYKDALDITKEEIGEKLVFTNSGYGGSGITIGEGGVDYQLEQFMKLDIERQTSITVLGAGWIGSLTALKLYAMGYKNLTVFADNLSDIPSFKAGGLVLTSMGQFPSEFERTRAIEFGINSYQKFQHALGLDDQRHPFIPSDGDFVRRLPYYTYEKSEGLEPYVKAGIMKSAIDVRLKILETGLSHNLFCYEEGIFVNTTSVLQHFHDLLFRKFQIPFINRLVTDFRDISSPVIFNCAGVRAADMPGRKNRASYIPTLGHLIMGKDQEPTKEKSVQNCMIIAAGEKSTLDGKYCHTSYYGFPKSYTSGDDTYQFVTGGTYIPGVSVNEKGELAQNHYPEMFDAVWGKARKFYGYKE